MSAPTERRIDALDVPLDVLEARLRSGRLSEYADLAKGRVVDPDYARSVQAGFVTPVDWDAPDCEPAFVDRTVANVQTGGRL